MVKGGPPRRWTRVHRKATAQPDATVPRPEDAATNQPKKKTARTHSHRLAPTWCGAGEVLGEGWRCDCNPRSCRAEVEKSGQRPPEGAPLDGNIPRRLAPTWCAARGTARGHKVPTSAWCSRLPGEAGGDINICIYIHIYIYIYPPTSSRARAC
jgi:hypothetical protein